MTEVRKRKVSYLLMKERNDKSECIPLGTYSRYVLALKDGESVKGAWHHKISRVSVPA